MRDRAGTDSGFTMIEITIVLAVLVPILFGIAVTTTSINRTIDANTRNADVAAQGRRMAARIGRIFRSASLSSIRVQATAADVAAARASAVGQWIEPTDLEWRSGIEFQCASGVAALNDKLATVQRRAVFVMESGETANAADDDGDGLVDEGRVLLREGAVTLDTLEGVEQLSFAIDRRLLKIRLTVARPADTGRVYRFVAETRYWIRNN